jgi:hypothetical protein
MEGDEFPDPTASDVEKLKNWLERTQTPGWAKSFDTLGSALLLCRAAANHWLRKTFGPGRQLPWLSASVNSNEGDGYISAQSFKERQNREPKEKSHRREQALHPGDAHLIHAGAPDAVFGSFGEEPYPHFVQTLTDCLMLVLRKEDVIYVVQRCVNGDFVRARELRLHEGFAKLAFWPLHLLAMFFYRRNPQSRHLIICEGKPCHALYFLHAGQVAILGRVVGAGEKAKASKRNFRAGTEASDARDLQPDLLAGVQGERMDTVARLKGSVIGSLAKTGRPLAWRNFPLAELSPGAVLGNAGRNHLNNAGHPGIPSHPLAPQNSQSLSAGASETANFSAKALLGCELLCVDTAAFLRLAPAHVLALTRYQLAVSESFFFGRVRELVATTTYPAVQAGMLHPVLATTRLAQMVRASFIPPVEGGPIGHDHRKDRALNLVSISSPPFSPRLPKDRGYDGGTSVSDQLASPQSNQSSTLSAARLKNSSPHVPLPPRRLREKAADADDTLIAADVVNTAVNNATTAPRRFGCRLLTEKVHLHTGSDQRLQEKLQFSVPSNANTDVPEAPPGYGKRCVIHRPMPRYLTASERVKQRADCKAKLTARLVNGVKKRNALEGGDELDSPTLHRQEAYFERMGLSLEAVEDRLMCPRGAQVLEPSSSAAPVRLNHNQLYRREKAYEAAKSLADSWQTTGGHRHPDGQARLLRADASPRAFSLPALTIAAEAMSIAIPEPRPIPGQSLKIIGGASNGLAALWENHAS